MGNLWARFRHRDVRIILLGLDSAGKTTILYRLKLDDLVTTIPTIGFNVESIQYKDLHLTAWDIGSRDKIRPLFRHYYKGADAVVFVIDSHDRERLDELNYDVIKPAVGAEELTNAVFLFLANKMDLPDTMSIEEISEKLGLRFLKHPWGILPVSAISGDGLQAALEWLAVRLGSSQVKARNFTATPPQTRSQQESRTATSSSSNVTSKTDISKTGPKTPVPPKPVILVNSKLVIDTKPAPSVPAVAVESTTATSSSTFGSNYQAFLARKSHGTVLNSFSSYSIAQNMKEDLTRRKLSGISKSDLRKMSCASLVDATNNRKLSTASMLDSPNQRKMSSVSLMDSPYRRKASTSFVIDPVAGKFTSVSFLEEKCARKLSGASLTGDSRLTDSQNGRKLSDVSLMDPRTMEPTCGRKFSAISLGECQDEPEKPQMSFLSAGGTSTPPTVKRKPEDLSLSGFGQFSPIMADYMHDVRKDIETSADSDNLTSPSDHLQPHLRALGLKKSPLLSNSAQYTVNSIDALKEEHYNEILRLLPEKYSNLYTRESFSAPNYNINITSRNQNILNALDDTNANTSIYVPIDLSVSKKGFSKCERQSSQESDSAGSSGNGKRSNLDLFCTPSRKTHSEKIPRNHSKGNNSEIVPLSARGAYCSRAYSAIKCLFFRPTKAEMQQETNSISSGDEEEREDENVGNKNTVDLANDIRVEVVDFSDDNDT